MSREYKIYFGKRFYKDKKGYYVNPMPIHAQRWVWINHHGTILEGMDVHHLDGDKGNNEIDNLEIISRSDHLKKHWQEGRFDLEQRRKQLAEARTWLHTPEGRKKQSADAKLGWKKRKRNPYRKNCLGCNKAFDTYQIWTKCCSDACYMRHRRRNGIGKVERNCWICGKVFFIDKYTKTRTCGRNCKRELQSIVKKQATG